MQKDEEVVKRDVTEKRVQDECKLTRKVRSESSAQTHEAFLSRQRSTSTRRRLWTALLNSLRFDFARKTAS